MNLMKFFNHSYMIQNLKKSKSVLAFFLGILPIISILSFLVLINSTGYDYIHLESISIIHYIGIYVIPIILSVCLFGFVYKKKSVDFIGSMPLSRKTIFVTNSITGILLLLLMIVLSGLSIYAISLITSVILPFRMIVDYILVWSISYIFVFILSNIAMSISGNTITQVVMTLLLLFFIPFLMDYITNDTFITYSMDYHTICIETSNMEKVCQSVEVSNQTNYTLPYNNIRGILSTWNGLYNPISLIKMVIISLVGLVIGKVLFVRRKMENNQTSFKNLKVHNLVKAFTMFPFIAIICILIPEANVSTLIIVCIFIFLLAYFIIYDLITKKSISDLKKSLLHFVIILAVLFPISMAIHKGFDNSYRVHDVNIKNTDITSIRFSLNTTSFSEFEYVEVRDQKSIELIMNKLVEARKNTTIPTNYKQLAIKVDDNNYKIRGEFSEDGYNEIMNYIKTTDDLKNTKTLLNNNKTYVLGFEEWYMKAYTSDSKLLEEARRVIEVKPSCQSKYKMNKELFIYAYHNGKVHTYQIDSCQSSILNNYVEQTINKENKDFLDRIKNMSYTNASNKGISYGINTYVINSYNVGYEELQQKLYRNMKEVYSFMKKYNNDSFDVTKEHLSISGHLDNEEYVYYTNRIEELFEVLEIVKEDLNDIN